jgi:PAS domain S-box-containing protein
MAVTTTATWTVLFEDALVGRCLVAPDGTILRANSEWLRSTGFPRDVVGEDIVALFPEVRDMALAMHARARAGHHVDVPRHAQTVNGRETWSEGSIDPVPMDGGTGLLITAREARDVVGKKVSEVLPGVWKAHPELLELCGRVVTTGRPERIEIHLEPLARWLTLSVYKPNPGHFVAVFDNIRTRCSGRTRSSASSGMRPVRFR